MFIHLHSFVCIVPTAPVQNLRTNESSPFSILIHWEDVPFQEQNGAILFYNVTTEFTDPATRIPELSANFFWNNQTNGSENYLLLRNLWHTVEFTVSVFASTRHGPGPTVYTTFMLEEGLLDLKYSKLECII